MKRFALTLALMIGGTLPAAQAQPANVVGGNDFPDDGAMMKLLDEGPGTIDIAPGRRADLAGCSGTDSPGLLRAVKSCWPVLQTYRLYAPLPHALTRWERLPRTDKTRTSPESEAMVGTADKIIADTSERTYPAQDVPLTIAYLSKGLIAIAQDDLEGFIAHYERAHAVVSSSQISAHWFRKDIPRIEGQIANAKAVLAARKELAAAKAIVGSE